MYSALYVQCLIIVVILMGLGREKVVEVVKVIIQVNKLYNWGISIGVEVDCSRHRDLVSLSEFLNYLPIPASLSLSLIHTCSQLGSTLLCSLVQKEFYHLKYITLLLLKTSSTFASLGKPKSESVFQLDFLLHY